MSNVERAMADCQLTPNPFVCPFNVTFGAIEPTWAEIGAALNGGSYAQQLAVGTEVGDQVGASLGEITAQLERMTGLRAWLLYDASEDRVEAGASIPGVWSGYQQIKVPNAGCLPPSCWPLAAGIYRNYNELLINFVYNNAQRGVVRRDNPCCGVEGIVIGTLYEARYKPLASGDFWASSLKMSLGTDGTRLLKKMFVNITPKSNVIELLDFEPYAVEDYGSGNSRTVAAGLSGEFGLFGVNYMVSKSHEYPEGHNGGRIINGNTHQLVWMGPPTNLARGTVGVETWRASGDSRIGFTVSPSWQTRDHF